MKTQRPGKTCFSTRNTTIDEYSNTFVLPGSLDVERLYPSSGQLKSEQNYPLEVLTLRNTHACEKFRITGARVNLKCGPLKMDARKAFMPPYAYGSVWGWARRPLDTPPKMRILWFRRPLILHEWRPGHRTPRRQAPSPIPGNHSFAPKG
jgi:hypothetical protein